MTINDVEKRFVELQMQEPAFTFEEIKYLINQDHPMSDAEITTYLEQTKEAAVLQKGINKKRAERKAEHLITDLQSLILKMNNLTQDMDNSDISSKTQLNILKEIRLTLMDVANLSGELKKQQEINISNYYLPINKIEEYYQNKLKQWKQEHNYIDVTPKTT
jgi:hypothetical protein